MKQFTLRGMSPELEGRIRLLAGQECISMNKAALRLLNQGAGLRGASIPLMSHSGSETVVGYQRLLLLK